MRTHYVLVDFENVQPANLRLLDGTPCKVMVFVGANQTRVPIELAQALQRFGTDAEYIRISGNGSNALDFHIAYRLGELMQRDPEACFHVISKDTGFDPLLDYLRRRGVRAQRSKDVADIPFLKLSNAKSRAEKLEAVVQNLRIRGQSRPRRVKTLTSSINALFQKGLDSQELTALVGDLERAGHISIAGEAVTYSL
jgi:hypothetical protein